MNNILNTQFSGLSFESIRENIKNHYVNGVGSDQNGNPYDFDGSAFNILLDSMAWAAYYTTIYSNMAVSETFLDTAQLRNNIVARAKELCYMPRSAKGATCKINLRTSTPFTDSAQNLNLKIFIPNHTTFSGSGEDAALQFIADGDQYINVSSATGNNHTFSGNVNIKQGQLLTQYFIMPSAQNTKIKLDAANIDADSITVYVNDIVYANEKNLINGSPTAQIFFMQEVDDKFIEIYFGENIIGMQPAAGATIKVQYLTSATLDGNGLSTFTLNANTFNILDENNVVRGSTPSTNLILENVLDSNFRIIRSSGGDDVESIESIRLNAPRMYATQNRLVTENDYKVFILSKFGVNASNELTDISIWGGEKNVPPVYGKVFICPYHVSGQLTTNQKENILSDISSLSIASIRHEIVNPEENILNVSINITIDSSKINLISQSLTSIISDAKLAAYNYCVENSAGFNKTIAISKLLAAIDDSNPAINNSLLTLTLTKTPVITSTNYKTPLHINFSDIAIESIKTNIVNGKFLADDMGVINVYDDNSTIIQSVGVIDYDKGEITITDVQEFMISNSEPIINFTITPKKQNIKIVRQNVLTFTQNNFTVTAEFK